MIAYVIQMQLCTIEHLRCKIKPKQSETVVFFDGITSYLFLLIYSHIVIKYKAGNFQKVT